MIPFVKDGALWVEKPPKGRREIVECPPAIKPACRLAKRLNIQTIFFRGSTNIPTSPSYSFLLDGKIFFSTIDNTVDYIHELSHLLATTPQFRNLLNVGLDGPNEAQDLEEEVNTCHIHQFLMKRLGFSREERESIRIDYNFKVNAGLMAYHGEQFLKKYRKDFYIKILSATEKAK